MIEAERMLLIDELNAIEVYAFRREIAIVKCDTNVGFARSPE